MLCLPASNSRAIDKLKSLDSDAVILDLEDAVAEEKKAEARANIRAFLTGRRLPGRRPAESAACCRPRFIGPAGSSSAHKNSARRR